MKETKARSLSNLTRSGAGRPKGAKNKTTIFQEVIKEGFEKKLEKDFKRVLDTVVSKAIEGDMTAAKLLFDRVVPIQKSIDGVEAAKNKGLTISINVGELTKQPIAIEAEYEEEDT